ncbi:unnamed protein product [Chironomus riparius]|uniref:UBX domain-containing protein n=1 Tax=Chironomus riparius TaxID=315576 RepID=A0A9P0IN91_9DIPT|nr:unnamed protein product [Chironomus riparius]
MESAANKIKKLFSHKNVNKSFKKAGPGRKLNDDASSSSGPGPYSKGKKKPSDVYVPVKRDDLTDEAKKARDAAIERLNIKQNASGSLNFSLKAIKEQARRELEQENSKLEASICNLNITSEDSASEKYSVEGVFFRCPFVSDEILSKKEWKVKIKAFLYEQMPSDPGLTACLIIKNCNFIHLAEDCILTLKKYLNNIITNPTETKYQRIRMTNRIFCEKVSNVEGAMEFLKAAGFKEVTSDNEAYLQWTSEYPLEMLIQLCEALDLSEVIPLEIDRNVKVLLPSQAEPVILPPDFFRLSKEELLNEQKAKKSAIEDAQILKTKAMREKEQERYVNRFKYTLIRIRFPDGLYLQGTFGVHENLSNVFEFVLGSLEYENSEFSLISPDGSKFSNEDSEKSLSVLRLVPNSVLKFSYENESKQLQEYLKQDFLMLIQSL